MSKYAHNKSTAKVSLLGDKILLSVGGKSDITDQEASHPDVVHAVRKGWISIEGSKSASAIPTAHAGVSFTEDEMKGSTTIPTVEKKVEATSTQIGSHEAKPKKAKKQEVEEE